MKSKLCRVRRIQLGDMFLKYFDRLVEYLAGHFPVYVNSVYACMYSIELFKKQKHFYLNFILSFFVSYQ